MLRVRRRLQSTLIEDAAGAPVTLTEGSWSWSLGMGGVAVGASYRHPRRIEIDGQRYPIRDHVMLLKLTAIVAAVGAAFIGRR